MKTVQKGSLMPLLIFTIIAFFAFFSQSVIAQDITQPDPPKSLKSLVDQGAQIFYMGDFEGMHGWVLIRKGKPEFFYENKERTAMIMGLMFNGEGDMITMGQLSALRSRVGDSLFAATDVETLPLTAQAPAAPSAANAAMPTEMPTRAQMMFADLVTSNWFTMNEDGAHDILAIIDPDCPHCKQMLQEIQPLLDQDLLRLRVIPVGQGEESMRRAALLLASGNPEDRLMRHINGDTEALNAPENITTTAVKNNTDKVMGYGFDATPMVVYKTLKNEIRIIRGRPTDYMGIVNDIREN